MPDNRKDKVVDIVAERLGIDTDTIEMLLGEFIEDTEKHLPVLLETIKSGNKKDIAEKAHYIKGAARNFELAEITEPAEKLEKTARAGDDADYEKMYGEVLAGFNQIKTSLT